MKVPAHLILLHVVEPPPPISEGGIAQGPAAHMRSLREYGQGLLARAREFACDLILMGTHWRHGVSRWVMGSDAEIVARHSPVPMLLVRGSE